MTLGAGEGSAIGPETKAAHRVQLSKNTLMQPRACTCAYAIWSDHVHMEHDWGGAIGVDKGLDQLLVFTVY